MNQQLYEWQEDCLRSWFEHDCRGIIKAVTGSGKTTIAIAALERLRALYGSTLKVKIVVPQTALAAQWSAALRNIVDLRREEIGFFYGSRKDMTERFCMIYVINSARYTLARHILSDLAGGTPVLLIADECHHYASPENRKIFGFLPRLKDYPTRFFSMGLSATPDIIGLEEYLVPALGEVFFQYTFEDAAKNQSISPFVISNIALPFDRDESEQYQEFSEKIRILTGQLYNDIPYLKRLNDKTFFHALQHISAEKNHSEFREIAAALLGSYAARKAVIYEAKARIDGVINLVIRLNQQDRIIIFGERIQQAQKIYARLNDLLPGQSGIYHSEQGKTVNQNVLDRYRNQEIRILVTCKALDEGLDVPLTNVGIVLSSSAQERQRTQRLGRVLRKSGNPLATLYYFYVKNTTDPYSYMEGFSDAPVKTLFLSYHADEQNFSHPFYEQLAVNALSSLVLKGANRETQAEFRHCIMLGLCRTDWLLQPEEINDRIQTSVSISEKNYWLSMKMLQIEHEENMTYL